MYVYTVCTLVCAYRVCRNEMGQVAMVVNEFSILIVDHVRQHGVHKLRIMRYAAEHAQINCIYFTVSVVH